MDRYCPDCDGYLTRAAVLAMQLRALAVYVHKEAGHAGANVTDCSLEPCKATARVLRETPTDD